MSDEQKQVTEQKQRRTRKSGDYRFQERRDGVTWVDSAAAYKGPAEALEGARKLCGAGAEVRAVRIASKTFIIKETKQATLEPAGKE